MAQSEKVARQTVRACGDAKSQTTVIGRVHLDYTCWTINNNSQGWIAMARDQAKWNALGNARRRVLKLELQAQVLALLEQGISQHSIAARLGKSIGTVADHVRWLRKEGKYKVKVRPFFRTAPLIRGRRKCLACGQSKTPGAFKSDHNAVCTMCIRARLKVKQDPPSD